MLDRAKFKETLENVAEIIRTTPEPMSQDEVLAYFADMELNEEQKKLVFAYLTTPQEDGAQAEATKSVDSEAEAMQDTESYTAHIDETEGEDIPDMFAADVFGEDEIAESPILQMYLDELALLPIYTKVQEDELYDRLIAGDQTVIQPLADCWLGRVLNQAKRHREAKAVLEDIIQEGNMGLFLELQKLLGSKTKVDFRSLLSDSIEKSMWAFIVESGEREDEGNTVVGKVSLVQEAKKILEEQFERGATTKELADFTKMQADELEGVLNLIEKANRS